MTLAVLDPGLLTSVQDAGRPDWTHLGVPVGGACDPWSLAVANLLAGNPQGAAAIEMTLIGATYGVRAPLTVGLGGADLGGVVRETGRRLIPGHSYRLEAGTTIAFPGDPVAGSGARAYLALAGGGVDVPLVLGSGSTALAAGFGGYEGRKLETGDVIQSAGAPESQATAESIWPASDDDPSPGPPGAPIRVLDGPAHGLEAIVAAEWLVGVGSDRVGLRLEGQPLPVDPDPRLLSHGVVWGSIQVPPDGSPIVLLADHQTTGGYPIAAAAITADRPRLGQLRPGEAVTFAATTVDEARAALVVQRAALVRGATALRAGAGWDDLWQSAGG